ncbi:MAG: hypothetical protein ACTSXG_03530 [Alphaproteobacteria bacterium]
MTKRFIKVVFFIILWVLVFSLLKIIIQCDISIEPIAVSQDASNEERYIVSYAGGNEVFFQNQNALVFSALNRGVDNFINYGNKHIDKQFVGKHKDILNEKKGLDIGFGSHT